MFQGKLVFKALVSQGFMPEPNPQSGSIFAKGLENF